MVSPLRYRNYGHHSRVAPSYISAAPVPSRRHSHPLPKPRPKVLKSPNKSPRSGSPCTSPSSRSPAVSPVDEDSASENNAIHYEIHVITGDALWAGTDANVFITLCGTEGETGRKQLAKKYTNLFERGRTDCFDLKVKQDLGKLTLLHIEEDETGFGAAWLLERVEVINMSTHKKTMFLCGEWLDHEHGTDRYLLPEQDEEPPDGEREPPDGQPTIEVTEPQDDDDNPPAASALAAEDDEAAIGDVDGEDAPGDVDGEDAPGDVDVEDAPGDRAENGDGASADDHASEPTDDDKAPLVSTDSL